MTLDEAREEVISGIDYAAYRETDTSLFDTDKDRLFGRKHYDSGRPIVKASTWAEGEFERKMTELLGIANYLHRRVPSFQEAQRLLEKEESALGRIIRSSKNPKA